MRNFIATNSAMIVTMCSTVTIIGLIINNTPLMAAALAISAATVITKQVTKA